MDVYAIITDRIIKEMEQGVIPWQKPWTGVADGAISRQTGKPYSLLNQMLLGKPGEYVTFTQCQREGGKVKKGAKSKLVVFWKISHKTKKDAEGNPVRNDEGDLIFEGIPFLRYFNVFHIEDCEGLEPKWTKDDELVMTIEPVEAAQNVFDEYLRTSGVKFESLKSNNASYSPVFDRIKMPLMEQFTKVEEYYSTLFHETVHSTGHASRLNRFDGKAGASVFGSESYSKEELVAEIGACVSLNILGIESKSSFRNSAAYVQNWLAALKDDKKLIASAASRTEKAVNLIFGKNDESEDSYVLDS